MCYLQNGIGGYYNPCITNEWNDENNGIKNVEDRHYRKRRRTTVSHSWDVIREVLKEKTGKTPSNSLLDFNIVG